MAIQGKVSSSNAGLVQRTQTFLQEVWFETWQKVTWPTFDDIKVSTKVTMYMLAVMAGIIFGLDYLFSRAMLVLLSLAG